MEETNTTELSLNYTRSGNWSSGGKDEYTCLRASYGFVVFLFVCMGICVFGTVGNGIVLWFLGFQMKRNHFTVYILNLAVADCSLLLLFLLFMLAYFIKRVTCYDVIFLSHNEVLVAVRCLCHLFFLCSLGLLTAISTERCVSVLFPIWYRCHRPKHLSGIVCGVLWTSAGLSILLCYICFLFDQTYDTLFASVAIVYPVILSLMMLISNVSMVMRLRCGSHRRHLGKIYVAVVLNIIFFFAFGMPFILNIFPLLSHIAYLFPEKVTFVLALLNSSINPVIYFLVGSFQQRRFQGSIKVALRRVFEEKAMSKEESSAPGGIPMESPVQGTAGEGQA